MLDVVDRHYRGPFNLVVYLMTKPLTFDLEDIEPAIEDNIGFCIACGAERECCEPDARNYKCEECGEMKVFGAEELIIMGLVG